MLKIKVYILLFFILVSFTVTAQEQQVPLDKEGKILVITRELARECDLFVEYRHFIQAVLFQVSEDEYILEITWEIDGDLVKHRETLNSRQVIILREKVSNAIKKEHSSSLPDQSGRLPLLIVTGILSYAGFGFSIPVTLDIDNPALFAGLYMVTSSAGFFIPFLLTKNAQVTRSQATFAISGAYLDILHGLVLNIVNYYGPCRG